MAYTEKDIEFMEKIEEARKLWNKEKLDFEKQLAEVDIRLTRKEQKAVDFMYNYPVTVLQTAHDNSVQFHTATQDNKSLDNIAKTMNKNSKKVEKQQKQADQQVKIFKDINNRLQAKQSILGISHNSNLPKQNSNQEINTNDNLEMDN